MNRVAFSIIKVCFYYFSVVLITVGGQAFPQVSKMTSDDFTKKSYSLISNVEYGEAVTVKGKKEKLLMDVYTPLHSSTVSRPLVVFIHGGGFRSNDKVGKFSSLLCESFTGKGIVVASINYRLSGDDLVDSISYFKALYRAQQDGKAAIRFFRKHSQKYNIDENIIFVAGTSAGAKTALHIAYLRKDDVPSWIDEKELGSFDGVSGNQEYSSKVTGVLNFWGALWDYRWIRKGDVPVYNVHGLNDKSVPSDSSFSYHGFKYGSIIIDHQAKSLGIESNIMLFENTGHTLDNDSKKQSVAVDSVGNWLLKLSDSLSVKADKR